MKKNKKSFFSMPLLSSLVVVIPVGITLLSYQRISILRDNDNFAGYDIKGDGNTFNLVSNTRLFRIPSFSKQNNYQGGACYEDYYFLASNYLESILIYDMESKRLYDVINNADENPSYHCNNISFGTSFYSDNDEFPLLYISMENSNVHKTNVYRVVSRGDTYAIDKIQTIYFPDYKTSGCYLPNSYIDQQNDTIYYGGYTERTYEKTATNSLILYSFDLPETPNKNMTKYEKEANSAVFLTLNNAKTVIKLESQTATQGGFISRGYLYQTYGITHPYFRVINLKNGCPDDQRIKEFNLEKMNNDNPGSFIMDEYENVAFCSNHIYSYGQKKMSLYEFNFQIDLDENIENLN